MSLLQRIEEDLLKAIKSAEVLERDVLRGLKSAIKNEQIEKGSELGDEDIEKVVAREVKRRKESIEAYDRANKPDLSQAERQELTILLTYLPEQLSPEAVEKAVERVIAQLGDKANTGAVMGELSAQFKGRADMGKVARLVNQKLSR